MARLTAAAALAVALCLAGHQARAALFDDLGGQRGITRIVDDATTRFLADQRVSKTFEETNMVRFKTMLSAQLCQLTGGPCEYHGRDMAAAHRGLAVNEAQFNALAEDLQDAMQAVGVSYHAQNRVLTLLAPMHRDVVSR